MGWTTQLATTTGDRRHHGLRTIKAAGDTNLRCGEAVRSLAGCGRLVISSGSDVPPSGAGGDVLLFRGRIYHSTSLEID